MRALLTKVLGDANQKTLKQIQPIVDEINDLEPEMQEATDDELREMGAEFRSRIAEGESLDDLLPEVFAAVREIAKRVSGKRHYDVQLIGGIVLHQGKIAEMKTGEGKTLTATLPIALNALTGLGVHLVTVNDYLASRDTQWMGPIYHALGLTVASIQHDEAFLFDPLWESEDERLAFLRPITRQEAYAADITYGTNNEFGFDYLRDNMVVSIEQCVQRDLELRDRRRSRQHPDRRGANAADHLRSGRACDRPLLPVRPDRQAAPAGAALRGRSQAQDRDPDRRGRRQGRGAARAFRRARASTTTGTST